MPTEPTTDRPPDADAFTPDERALLARYCTNTDRPVFALRGLPEVVKGALFARYSRSPKSLRRLLLDEFADDLPALEPGVEATPEGGGRAERLYERVFVAYGDDSVAQLGGAHAALEQISNLLTKVVEWGRLAAYLEQSTRYIPYDDRPGGRYRYYRDPDVLAGPHGDAYVSGLDAVFDAYAALLPRLRAWAERAYPQDAETSDRAYGATITAKVCDTLRGLLPAATTSNVGMFATGQAYEGLLLRLRAHELAEAREVGDALLGELREVIPSFLTRVDRPERGGAWAQYLADTRDATRGVAEELLGTAEPEPADEVTLVDWDPDAEVRMVTGMLYPHTALPETQLRQRVEAMSREERARVMRAYVGERGNRRHKPGRALERVAYRFDVCGDYGAFRDLQRHRMATIEWQPLTPRHGYETPPEIDAADADDPGISAAWHGALERQAALWERLAGDRPAQAQYVVGFAYRVRYSIQLNARSLMHMVELRTQPQGHRSYRRVCQRMHELVAERAGHHVVADMMGYVDHSSSELERLEAERAQDRRTTSG
ncbi:thymidylate synthase [Egibacter rhizosphaerae]|uniref:Thymidylate synthase n=1 Tax=Egibacter rhizosphaerae TaxID=1670831 RepID=A0A411YCM1_9ACTN|nr:FAD-dependent thymidylate synthase [Egibacter rhizosphaerae]QBI18938.1 thymidylate synthase [Egibacter rhizosphaerae]